MFINDFIFIKQVSASPLVAIHCVNRTFPALRRVDQVLALPFEQQLLVLGEENIHEYLQI